MLSSSDSGKTRATSRSGPTTSVFTYSGGHCGSHSGVTSSISMFVRTPVLGNDALEIPLALVRGHRRYPAHLTKCPLAATPSNATTERHHSSHGVSDLCQPCTQCRYRERATRAPITLFSGDRTYERVSTPQTSGTPNAFAVSSDATRVPITLFSEERLDERV